MADINTIKKLREETAASVMDINRALEEAGGNVEKAKEILKQKGFERAEKKAERTTGDGLVFTYTHSTGKVGAILVLYCETDFVAKTDDFKNLGREVVMQIAAMGAKTSEELLKQSYIRDSSKTIETLIKEVIAKTGENVRLGEFSRLAI